MKFCVSFLVAPVVSEVPEEDTKMLQVGEVNAAQEAGPSLKNFHWIAFNPRVFRVLPGCVKEASNWAHPISAEDTEAWSDPEFNGHPWIQTESDSWFEAWSDSPTSVNGRDWQTSVKPFRCCSLTGEQPTMSSYLDGTEVRDSCQDGTDCPQSLAKSGRDCPDMRKTYEEARDHCKAHGLALCTENQLKAGQACNTGCGFDFEYVWACAGGCHSQKTMTGQTVCENDDDCSSGWCRSHDCPSGYEECERSDDCPSRWCKTDGSKKCSAVTKTKRPRAAHCTADEDCDSGDCRKYFSRFSPQLRCA